MTQERLVAVSYPVDEEFTRINAEVLAGDATIVCTYDLDDAERRQVLRRSDALLAWEPSREIPAGALAEAGRLRFVQLLAAGVDALDFSVLPGGLTLASNVGAYAVA